MPGLGVNRKPGELGSWRSGSDFGAGFSRLFGFHVARAFMPGRGGPGRRPTAGMGRSPPPAVQPPPPARGPPPAAGGPPPPAGRSPPAADEPPPAAGGPPPPARGPPPPAASPPPAAGGPPG